MGYRSDVIFACTADAVPIMLAAVSKSAALKELLFVHTDKKLIGDYDDEGSYLFRWNSIKWYDSYPAIQAFNQMIEKIVEKLDEEGYRWVCIGEEPGDNRVEGWGFDHICISREIAY